MSKTEKLFVIEYNCKVVGDRLSQAVLEQIINEGGTTFFSAGQYFGILAIKPQQKSYHMLFVEFKNNENVFYKFLDQGLRKESPTIRENAIRVFNQLKLDYDKNYSLVELVEGEPPKY